MSALIGSTGFVGGHLQKRYEFTQTYNRANISEIQGLETDLLICAGLPAEKWRANRNAESDLLNMSELAESLTTVQAKKAVLISTIDVYQPAVNVDENDWPDLKGVDAYGRNRAWFEIFFRLRFPDSVVLRLPGLFAPDLRKNLIFDLMTGKKENLQSVHRDSRFQFFNMAEIWKVTEICLNSNIPILNVASEPISAQEIASLFGEVLGTSAPKVNYDMRSIYDKQYNGGDGYLYSSEKIISEIRTLVVN
jgi:nucleoside-diphosphate-sugar epimerase